MAQIQVTASQLNEKKSEIAKLNKQLKNAIDETDSIVRQLKNEWLGDASDAFQASYKSNSNKLMQATEGVNSYIRALENIIQKYKSTEAKNVKIAQSMK